MHKLSTVLLDHHLFELFMCQSDFHLCCDDLYGGQKFTCDVKTCGWTFACDVKTCCWTFTCHVKTCWWTFTCDVKTCWWTFTCHVKTCWWDIYLPREDLCCGWTFPCDTKTCAVSGVNFRSRGQRTVLAVCVAKKLNY